MATGLAYSKKKQYLCLLKNEEKPKLGKHKT